MSGVPLLPSVPTLLVCASLGVPTVVEQHLDGGADVEIVDQVSHRDVRVSSSTVASPSGGLFKRC